MVVVGLARREHRLQELKSGLPDDLGCRLHRRPYEVSDEQQLIENFAWIDRFLAGVLIKKPKKFEISTLRTLETVMI